MPAFDQEAAYFGNGEASDIQMANSHMLAFDQEAADFDGSAIEEEDPEAVLAALRGPWSKITRSIRSYDDWLAFDYFPTRIAYTQSGEEDAPLRLTAGIELEVLYCFRWDLMERVLRKREEGWRSGDLMVKTISEALERDLRSEDYPLQEYRSWAVAEYAHEESSLLEEGSAWCKIRTMEREAVLMVERVFKDLFYGYNGYFDIRPSAGGQRIDHTCWTITTDKSIQAYSQPELRAALASAGRRTYGEDLRWAWSSFGIEMVSPAMDLQDTTDLKQQLGYVLQGLTKRHGARLTTIEPSRTGLHVHIGLMPRSMERPGLDSLRVPDDTMEQLRLHCHGPTEEQIKQQQQWNNTDGPTPNNSPLPIRLVQILAYICIVYEDEINKLHHPARRYRIDEIQSNRETFTPEPTNTPTRFRWDAARDCFVGLRCNLDELDHVRTRLFDDVNKAADPLEALLALVSPDRGRLVNFTSLRRGKGRAHTIEFRQHAATLDKAEILWWVTHCEAMVQLAHRLSVLSDEELWKKMPVLRWDDRIDVEDLWVLMELSEDAKMYYRLKKMAYEKSGEAVEGMPLFEEVIDEESYVSDA